MSPRLFLVWSQLGHCYNPSIMEQTLIFSGLTYLPGPVFWKMDLSALFYVGSHCSIPIGAYYKLPEELGITAVDRLYPLKPKKPV
ncbi:hypothetical protein [Algoriphagus pacificus]|uniref:Uncharacterized protein n=1 Tax=Algoriphagus pacificus TaxID=2811234 RepID=A0ABS3CJA6_9BACT|nr:hypothetical protein [Algoriphagus pacificus]MBN7816256.1 hypothetical protein [Algoriphagus pacificus]